MDVDALMDVANQAVEAVFGREVTYTPAGGGATSTFDADFQERYEMTDAGGTVDATGTMPALDVRASALEDLGLIPRTGDRVSFDVRDVSRTYRVTNVLRPAPGSVVLVLGEQS